MDESVIGFLGFQYFDLRLELFDDVVVDLRLVHECRPYRLGSD